MDDWYRNSVGNDMRSRNGWNMRENIRVIFEQNTELIRRTEIALQYYREQQYDKALGLTAQAIDQLRDISEAIFSDREYFAAVSDASVAEMLTGLLQTKKKKDYVLLADLFEMQLLTFLYSIQELILNKEDYMEYDEEAYAKRTALMKEKLAESIRGYEKNADTAERDILNLNALLDAPIDPERLLDNGYRVEFTSSGRMTVAIRDREGRDLYLHSNGNVSKEAFLLAKHWTEKPADTYIIYGLGMGYHIEELLYLSPDSKIEIYETDMNILKLSCAFSKIEALVQDMEVQLIYDPDGSLIRKRLKDRKKNEAVCVHYPSLRNVKEEGLREVLSGYIPWVKLIENI